MSGMAGARREPVTVILLSLVTCGFYGIYWIYKVSEETLAYSGEQDMSPVIDTVLCCFVPFYALYWIYKQSQRITRMQAQAGLPAKDEAILHTILGLVIGLVTIYMFQDNLNKVWDSSRNAQAM
ncbi:DUF4234 domain-containing protein [Armatimonas sp.]|uniref:DUF4234 domain-containing protein n=1 Tax=Armatimonas sp. TaxID=1872638 RepID=UPI00286C0984|nr:DUF4234 domain-containing protein [Armatimonas sp.]